MKSSLPRRSPFCYFCYFCGTLLSHADSIFIVPQSSAFPRKSIFVPQRERKSLLRTAEPFCHFCHFCGTFIIPCGWLFHERVFLSHEKNGNLCSALRSLSVISVISVGHYYLMRIVFYCPDFYCPAEMKEIQVSDVALGRPSASKLQGQELQKVKILIIIFLSFGIPLG